MNKFMKAAISEAEVAIQSGIGGPFGAVVVKDGVIIGRGHNEVIANHDPTAHAEMQAIREAAQKLGTHDLGGCTIYATSEPCPMCYSAIHWARIDKIYYGCSRKDAADIGFDDELIYDVLRGKARHARLTEEQIDREACLGPFKAWDKSDKKILY
jgi:guanine deaminase